jgi:hypothetical protein
MSVGQRFIQKFDGAGKQGREIKVGIFIGNKSTLQLQLFIWATYLQVCGRNGPSWRSRRGATLLSYRER